MVLKLGAAGLGDLRILDIEGFHLLSHNVRNNEAHVFLIVCWNDIPWRFLSRGRIYSFLVGCLVVILKASLSDIAVIELPIFLLLVNARDKAITLFIFTQVQKELYDPGPIPNEV